MLFKLIFINLILIYIWLHKINNIWITFDINIILILKKHILIYSNILIKNSVIRL